MSEFSKILETATGPAYFWSRKPGSFVMKKTGEQFSIQPIWTGTVREWYETLIETSIDVFNELENTGRSSTQRIAVVHPDVHLMFQCSVLYHPVSKKTGVIHISRDMLVLEDSELPYNKILLGYENTSTDMSLWGSVTVKDLHRYF
jgi:hypothetical protein